MACETSDLTSWHVWKPEGLPDWVVLYVLFPVQLEVLSADMSESLKVWLSGCLIPDTTLCWWSEMVWLADLTYPSELSDSRHLRHCKSVQTNCHVADAPRGQHSSSWANMHNPPWRHHRSLRWSIQGNWSPDRVDEPRRYCLDLREGETRPLQRTGWHRKLPRTAHRSARWPHHGAHATPQNSSVCGVLFITKKHSID